MGNEYLFAALLAWRRGGGACFRIQSSISRFLTPNFHGSERKRKENQIASQEANGHGWRLPTVRFKKPHLFFGDGAVASFHLKVRIKVRSMQKVFTRHQARKSICEPDDPRYLRVLLFEVSQALRVSKFVNICYLLLTVCYCRFRGPKDEHSKILKIEEVLLVGI